MQICKIEGCTNKYYGKGFCKKHYDTNKKYGDPLHWCRGDANTFIIENNIVEVSIPHTEDYFTINIDDWNQVKQYSWYLKNPGYISATINDKTIYLHRFLMNAQKGDIIDHVDRNKMNNTRSNLRLSDYYKNAWNSEGYGKTKVKGVMLTKEKKYMVRIMRNYQSFYLGTFDNIEDAKNAYIIKALEFHDETYL